MYKKLVEIDRNLAHRDKLTVLELCDLLKTSKNIYESLPPAKINECESCRNKQRLR